MKNKFTESIHCLSRVHCVTCRTDKKFQGEMKEAFNWDGICPIGLTKNNLAKNMPSLLQQAKNLTSAVGRATQAVARGEKFLVSKRVKARRQKICDGCEFYDIDASRCAKCGCGTAYKLSMATEECPVGKWKKSRISKKAK